VVVAAALAVVPVARAERLIGLFVALVGVGLAGFVYGLLRGRSWAVPWAVVVLGAAYAASLFLPERGLDRQAPLVAAGFVLLAELAYWTLELRTPLSPEPGMLARRGVLVGAAGIGALVVAAIAIVATAIPLAGGLTGDLLGVAAAVAALAVVATLADRGRRQSST
jgi:hypothetical protein